VKKKKKTKDRKNLTFGVILILLLSDCVIFVPDQRHWRHPDRTTEPVSRTQRQAAAAEGENVAFQLLEGYSEVEGASKAHRTQQYTPRTGAQGGLPVQRALGLR